MGPKQVMESEKWRGLTPTLLSLLSILVTINIFILASSRSQLLRLEDEVKDGFNRIIDRQDRFEDILHSHLQDPEVHHTLKRQFEMFLDVYQRDNANENDK